MYLAGSRPWNGGKRIADPTTSVELRLPNHTGETCGNTMVGFAEPSTHKSSIQDHLPFGSLSERHVHACVHCTYNVEVNVCTMRKTQVISCSYGNCASEVNARRGVCVSECEDGLQMAGRGRFMSEQWLCNVSVWDGQDISDLSAAAPHSTSPFPGFLPGTPYDCLSLRFSLRHGEQEKKQFWQWLWIQWEINPPYCTISRQYFRCEMYCAVNSPKVQYTCFLSHFPFP